MSSTSTSLAPTPARTSLNSALSTTPRALATPMKTTPSTPASQPVEARPSPGTFKHPRLAEIAKRQHQTLLTQGNVRSAVINAAALVSTFPFYSVFATIITTILSLLSLSRPTAVDTTVAILWATRGLFLTNIVLSLRQTIPYISKKDTIEDIPLTPSQRALLGLPASTTNSPATQAPRTGSPLGPSPGYITPPRYHRRLSSNNSAGSSDRRSISANYTATPGSANRHALGFSPSPTQSQTQPRQSIPYSPIGGDRGSPLLHKAIERQQRRNSQTDFDLSGAGGGRRSSFGESGNGANGLGRSQSVSNRAGMASPPPMGRAKKGVNFKWLYDQEYSLAGGAGAGIPAGVNGGARRGLASSQSMHF